MGKNTLKKTAQWLLAIGGLNWGLSIFNINLVTWLTNLANLSMLNNLIYGLVGASAIYWGYNELK